MDDEKPDPVLSLGEKMLTSHSQLTVAQRRNLKYAADHSPVMPTNGRQRVSLESLERHGLVSGQGNVFHITNLGREFASHIHFRPLGESWS
jgi:hypothetical protein